MSRKYLCPQEGSVLEILGEREISRAKRFLKEIMNQNWNFQGDVAVGEVGRVGGGWFKPKIPLWEGYELFSRTTKSIRTGYLLNVKLVFVVFNKL